MKIAPILLLLLFLFGPATVTAQMPIDDLWKSAAFRRAFTASYGIDARIEPTINTAEREVLETVANEMEDGDRDGAVAALTGSSLLGDSAALMFSLGNLRFEQGRNDDALENFERAVELYPNFRDAHRNLAMVLVNLERFDEAQPHLVRALELGARDGLTLGLLGYVHLGAGRHQAALQAYRLAQLTMPEETQWKIGEAEALLELGDARATASIYGELLSAQPEDAAHWGRQAEAWLQLAEPEKAIANLEMVRRMGKLEAAGVISLGHLYLNATLLEDALACYRDAIEAEPPAPATRVVDAVENLVRFRHFDAADSLAKRLEERPAYAALLTFGEPGSEPGSDWSRLQRSLALIALETGEDREEAAKRVEALVESNPLDGAALVLLGRFRLEQERVEEAIMLFEQATAEAEHEVEALRRIGEVRVRQGNYEAALEVLERALALQPDEALETYIRAVRGLR